MEPFGRASRLSYMKPTPTDSASCTTGTLPARPALTADPPELSRYATRQRHAADRIGAQAAVQRGDIADLTMTFGIIGADFLAATAFVLDARAHALDSAATRHADQGSGTRRARSAYTATDHTAARQIGPVAGDSRELRL